jgi:energy-coupling factor transporter ATP-binding protein EcfA2
MLVAQDLWARPPGAPDPVVRGVSLKVAPGEWVALAGPNGGGKTTLALALAGLLPPERGELSWRGGRLDSARRGDPAAPVVTLLQDPSSQLFEATLAADLALTARHLGQDEAAIRAEVERLAARFGFEDELGEPPHALSAGRQQLALIAAALVARPALLVGDEPGAHLDPAARRSALDCVAEAVAAGLAVVWVTQDPEELARAHRVVVLGEEGPWDRAPAAAAPGLPGASDAPELLRLEVAASPGSGGPRVRTAERFAVSVPARGVVALHGPNAGGKSVLLHAAVGLAELQQVRVRWRDRSGPPPLLVSQYPERQIFEERVADEVVHAAVCRGRPRPEALEAARVGLLELGYEPEAFLARRTWSLSGGEKRMLAVLGGLIAPATLLALDEPTGGLDPRCRDSLAKLLSRRAMEGAILIATQDPGWAAGAGASLHGVGP